MTPRGLRGRRAVLGIIAAAALAAGGTAAVAAASAGGVSAHGASANEVSAHGVSAHGAAVHRTASTAQVRAALVRYLSTSRPLASVTSGGGLKPGSPDSTAGSRGSAQVGSYNWSGYADTAAPGTFTAVSATWRQPATICSPEQRLTSTWVGLDGFSDSTVEQDGTLAYCFEGQAAYYTWWEMYPGGTVTVGSAVRPGDLIKASVTESAGSYTLSVADLSHRSNSFSTVQPCAPAGSCQDSSAEWIAERPAFSIGIAPLSVFTPWLVSSATRTANGTKGSIGSGPGATGITMVDATQTYALDNISGLRFGGTSFSARWLNSY
jgi:hypothetical protein